MPGERTARETCDTGSSAGKVDFAQMYAYIDKRSPRGAERWRRAFESAIRVVSETPEVGGLAPENNLTRFELRQKLFKTKHGLTYRIVYTVSDGSLIVLRVRGPGQPPLTADETPVN